MTRIRSVPVAQVQQLIAEAVRDALDADQPLHAGEYAAKVVGELKPVVRPPKRAEIKQIWVWNHDGPECIAVEGQRDDRLLLATHFRMDKSVKRWQEGREWFRTERDVIAHQLQRVEESADWHANQWDRSASEAFVLREMLAEMPIVPAAAEAGQ